MTGGIMVPEQCKHKEQAVPEGDGARIISYNLNEDERPFGVKVRFKVRVVTGKAAGALDQRQAEAFKEYLKWVRQYRQSRNSGHADT
jgi:hypothetical protein